MLNITIVEDEPAAQEVLKGYLARYGDERGLTFNIVCYGDAFAFLEKYKLGSDIIFMDIELPGIDGMEAAKRLRQSDDIAVLIFVTNMAQFAVKGYEVEALDFVVKPVSYDAFCMKMDRAVRAVNNASANTITVTLPYKVVRIDVRELCYVEVTGHKLLYHTDTDVFEGRGVMSAEEERLRPFHFLRCNSCYLINPIQVKEIGRNDVEMRNGDVLQISHSRRKKFLADIAEYLGDNK